MKAAVKNTTAGKRYSRLELKKLNSWLDQNDRLYTSIKQQQESGCEIPAAGIQFIAAYEAADAIVYEAAVTASNRLYH